MRSKIVSSRLAPLVAVLVFASLTGCGSGSSRLDDPKPHNMGDEVRAGALGYTVTSSQWLSALSDDMDTILPQHRFLALSVSITNNGSQEMTVPLLTLVGEKGKEYMEVAQVRGMPQWLGALRLLRPSQTITGKIVFDVPDGAYNLRITDGGDMDNERTALIEIPMTLNAPLAVPEQPRPPVPNP